jgi:hypothetical protein
MMQTFAEAFGDKLMTTKRWDAFSLIAEILLTRRAIKIVETGCVRQENNWSGDGQSTVVWSWLAQQTGGKVSTCDINRSNCNTAAFLAPDAVVYNMDSITFLRGYYAAESIDLLYLDSYDLTDDYRAALHQIGELAAIYERLPSGCLIAVDDCVTENRGKHVYVAAFFDSIGVLSLISSHVTVWQKP